MFQLDSDGLLLGKSINKLLQATLTFGNNVADIKAILSNSRYSNKPAKNAFSSNNNYSTGLQSIANSPANILRDRQDVRKLSEQLKKNNSQLSKSAHRSTQDALKNAEIVDPSVAATKEAGGILSPFFKMAALPFKKMFGARSGDAEANGQSIELLKSIHEEGSNQTSILNKIYTHIKQGFLLDGKAEREAEAVAEKEKKTEEVKTKKQNFLLRAFGKVISPFRENKETIGDAANSAEIVDPSIAAAKETKNILAPFFKLAFMPFKVVGGLFGFGKEKPEVKEEKKQTKVLKKILQALKGGASAAGGGILGSLLGMLTKPFGMVGSLGAGLLGGAGGLLGGLLGRGSKVPGKGVGGFLSKGFKSLLKRAALPVGLLMGAGSIYANQKDESLTPEQRRQANTVEASSMAGAALGATIGTLILPGVGTVLGGILGSFAGEILGSQFAQDILSVWDVGVKKMSETFSWLVDWYKDTSKNYNYDDDSISETAARMHGRRTYNIRDGLGRVSREFESGDKGLSAISKGKGDAGGASYGEYQLSSKSGTLQKYLQSSGYSKHFEGLKPGSKEFNAQWRKLAETDHANFQASQDEYIKSSHYDPQVQKLKDSGIDLSKRGRAVQEAIFSTAVQFGGNTNLIKNALSGKDINKLSDSRIISEIQGYKIKNNDALFKSSSAEVRAGTLKRARHEGSKLLEYARADTMRQPYSPSTVSSPKAAYKPTANISKPMVSSNSVKDATVSVHVPPSHPNYNQNVVKQPIERRVPNEKIAWISSGGTGMDK